MLQNIIQRFVVVRSEVEFEFEFLNGCLIIPGLSKEFQDHIYDRHLN